MAYKYRSPLRPLDIGHAARMGGVEIDWDNTTVGRVDPLTMRERVYAFTAPLPAAVVEALELVQA